MAPGAIFIKHSCSKSCSKWWNSKKIQVMTFSINFPLKLRLDPYKAGVLNCWTPSFLFFKLITTQVTSSVSTFVFYSNAFLFHVLINDSFLHYVSSQQAQPQVLTQIRVTVSSLFRAALRRTHLIWIRCVLAWFEWIRCVLAWLEWKPAATAAFYWISLTPLV